MALKRIIITVNADKVGFPVDVQCEVEYPKDKVYLQEVVKVMASAIHQIAVRAENINTEQ